MQGKKWYKSKTVWVNIIAAAVDAATAYATGGALTALSVVNLILRSITKDPIVK